MESRKTEAKRNRRGTAFLAGVALLSSVTGCNTSSTNGYLGTMAGAEIGGTIGEAIGWLSTSRHDGPGKAMVGSIIGTVAGAVIGNQIATQSEKNHDTSRRQNQNSDDYAYGTATQSEKNYDYQTSGGYDTYSPAPADNHSYSIGHHPGSAGLTIGRVSFQDENGDGKFSRYETINVIYEVTNNTSSEASVSLSIDNPHYANAIAFSPVQTARIAPGKTIRYKAKAFMKNNVKARFVDINVYADSPTAGHASSVLKVKCE